MSDRYRVGVVGGGIGRTHIHAYKNLPDQFDVIAMCDHNDAKARDLATEFDIPRIATDVSELYRMDDLDIIDICTPSYLHYAQTLDALAAGKHVICEKPVAGSLKQVDELITAEAQSGKRVMPIFQYRFGHGLQKLKWLRDQGITGHAWFTTVETSWRRRAAYYEVPWRGKWETELGGMLVTLAIHAQDAVRYLLGPMKSVTAHVTTLVNDIETDDTFAASVQMADGSICSIAGTTGSAHEISRHRFCFDNLTAESNTQPYTNTGDDWTFSGDSPEIDARIEEALKGFEPLPEGTHGQLYRYYCAMQSGKELPVVLADARAALELITAIYYSARTKQVVGLPLSDDHPLYAGWQPSQLKSQESRL